MPLFVPHIADVGKLRLFESVIRKSWTNNSMSPTLVDLTHLDDRAFTWVDDDDVSLTEFDESLTALCGAGLPSGLDLWQKRLAGRRILWPCYYMATPDSVCRYPLLSVLARKRIIERSLTCEHNASSRFWLPIIGSASNLGLHFGGRLAGKMDCEDYVLGIFPDAPELPVTADTFVNSIYLIWKEICSADINVHDVAIQAASGDLVGVVTYLRNGRGVDAAVDQGGNTLLYYASVHNQVEVVRTLLEMGADVNRTVNALPSGKPITSILGRMVRMGVFCDALIALIEAGADPNGVSESDCTLGRPFLHRSKRARTLLADVGVQGVIP